MLPYLLLFAVPGQIEFTNEPPQRVRGPRTPIVKQCEKLERTDSTKFINRLGRAKEFSKLKELYESGISNGAYAATVYARELDDDKVVAFCCQFELGSTNWDFAFWGLWQGHRKKAVIGYIKQIAQSRDVYVRVTCYRVCNNGGWGDLVEEAKGDVGCTLRLIYCGGAVNPCKTIGTVAQDYVKKFSKKEKRGHR